MNIVSTKNLKYKVKIKNENNEVINEKIILDDVNIDVKKGEFIAILGHNGSGKSTFAKHLNALLLPNEGSVFINGEDTNKVEELWKIRKECGMVFQNPDNQIVGVTVEEDVGFGPENLGVPCKDIWKRVETSLAKTAMLKYRKKSPNHLSGGQKQRVAIASSLAMRPECIVLDEPTAMLDPQGRKEVLKIIRQLNKEEKMTIILITHHMDEAVQADRIIVMDNGKPVLNGTPKEVFSDAEKVKNLKLDVPQIMELAYRLNEKEIISRCDVLNVDEFVSQILKDKKLQVINAEKDRQDDIKWNQGKNTGQNEGQNEVRNEGQNASRNNGRSKEQKKTQDKVRSEDENLTRSEGCGERVAERKASGEILKLEDVSCTYEGGTAMEVKALKNVSLSIGENEFIGIMGHTGSGKSTLIQVMNGLIKPSEGSVLFKGTDISEKSFKKKELHFSVGLVFQYPESQLFEETVLKDVMFGPLNKGLSREEAAKVSADALAMLGLNEEYFEKSPFELSGGEMRRIAIAGVIAMEPEVIILDEPTAGLDPKSRKELLDSLKKLKEEKKRTVIIVSHNMEDIANYVNRLIVIDEGNIKYDDIPTEVFKHIDKLEQMGLAVPQVTYAMQKLKESGFDIADNILTVDEAVRELDKVSGRRI